MKKVLSLVAVCVLLVGMMACGVFSASAATPKEEIIAAVKAVLPAEDFNKSLPTLENVLQQIDVTAEQAKAVIANINEVATHLEGIEVKHLSLSEYSAAEQQLVLDNLTEACDTLGLTYELIPAKNPTHIGDVIAIFKLKDGTVVAEIDHDVKKTNAPEMNLPLVLTMVTLLVLAAGAAVYGKKVAAR